MDIETKFKSTLILKNIFVEKTTFERNINVPETGKLTFNFDNESEELETGDIHVRLNGSVKSNDNSIKVSATVFAIFGYEVSPGGSDILEENVVAMKENSTVAIMFPYLRAQLALVTNQAGIGNIFVPAININAYLEDKRKLKQLAENN